MLESHGELDAAQAVGKQSPRRETRRAREARFRARANPSRTTPPLLESACCPFPDPLNRNEHGWPGVSAVQLGRQLTALKDGWSLRARSQSADPTILLKVQCHPPLVRHWPQALSASRFQGLSMNPCKLRPQACPQACPQAQGSFLYLVPRREKMPLGP